MIHHIIMSFFLLFWVNSFYDGILAAGKENETLRNGADTVFGALSVFGYDARVHHHYNKMYIGGIAAYVLMGLWGTLLDLIFIMLDKKHVKVQGEKSFFTVKQFEHNIKM